MIAVEANPLDDFGLLQDQGRHIPWIMKGGHTLKNTLNGESRSV